jgi:hypothetical protein
MQPSVHRVRTALRPALLLLAALLALLAPAAADEAADRARIDDLFAQLRMAPDEAAAKAIDQQIWFL